MTQTDFVSDMPVPNMPAAAVTAVWMFISFFPKIDYRFEKKSIFSDY